MRRWIKNSGSGTTLTEQVLELHGIKEEDRELFLHGTVSDLRSAKAFKDGEKAGKIIKEAIACNNQIVVYTDYDSDGAAGGAVAVMMLKDLGAKNTVYYTNNRFTQGYGMCPSGVDEILEKYPEVKVILTVDNGIAAHAGVSHAKDKGLTVVVTDHHEPAETLPPADALVDPKRKDCSYPFKGICGATVVWKVLRELYPDVNKANEYLDILAIATVGDVVPLVDENRIIVKEGIKLLEKENRYSLKRLKDLTGVTKIDATNTLGFLYVPIINAVGRLDGDINPVIDMYMSEDEGYLESVITKLIALNEERKEMTVTQTEIAEKQLENIEIPEVIVVFHPELHEGIVGLIAGRIKEKYHRPTLVLTETEDGGIKGSARSIEGFNMKENLDHCKDLLGGYGGHPMAAGLSLPKENLEDLKERLISLGKKNLSREDLIKKYYYIDHFKEEEITQNLVEEFAQLEPFGASFPKPLIRLEGMKVHRTYTMGTDKRHLKLVGEKISVIGWGQAENYQKRGNPLVVSALGVPEINIFRNNVNVQFMISEDNFK